MFSSKFRHIFGEIIEWEIWPHQVIEGPSKIFEYGIEVINKS